MPLFSRLTKRNPHSTNSSLNQLYIAMNNKIIAKNSGFTLAELLITMGSIAIIFFAVAACGWGLAFAFSVKVLVPWLGIPAAWAHAAAKFSA